MVLVIVMVGEKTDFTGSGSLESAELLGFKLGDLEDTGPGLTGARGRDSRERVAVACSS